MKRAKPAKRSAPAKSKTKPDNVDEYLASLPAPARARLRKLRAVIRSAVPRQATETISYGIPAFKHKGVLVWFAAFSEHCSLFPTAAIIDAFKHDLRGFSTSKGTIHFPSDQPLPAPLIKKIVKARVAQVEKKKTR